MSLGEGEDVSLGEGEGDLPIPARPPEPRGERAMGPHACAPCPCLPPRGALPVRLRWGEGAPPLPLPLPPPHVCAWLRG